MKKDLERIPNKDLVLASRLPKNHLSQFSSETLLAMRAVLNAAKAMKKVKEVKVSNKEQGAHNYFTAWDEASEAAIFETILSRTKDPILSEETTPNLPNPLNNPRLWVADPIDGSANAKSNCGFSVISLGFLENGVPVSGAVFNPLRNELIYGQVGVGTYIDGEQVWISNQSDLTQASIISDLGYEKETTHKHGDLFKLTGATPLRMLGTSVLSMAYTAAGRFDLFFYAEKIKPWDNAAAFALIKAAGGTYRGLDGRVIDIMSEDVVAGPEVLVDQFINKVKEAK